MSKSTVRVGLTAAFLAAAPAVWAQDLALGVKGGASSADLAGLEDAFGNPPSKRHGLVAGAFLTLPLSGRISLQPEALFAQKGARFDTSDLDLELQLDYVEVPLLLKARFGGGGIRPYAFAGPYIGLRLRARAKADAGEDGRSEESFEDSTKGTDLGVVGGAGVELGHFLVEARYARGLSGIAKGDVDDDAHNAVASLLVGFRF